MIFELRLHVFFHLSLFKIQLLNSSQILHFYIIIKVIFGLTLFWLCRLTECRWIKLLSSEQCTLLPLLVEVTIIIRFIAFLLQFSLTELCLQQSLGQSSPKVFNLFFIGQIEIPAGNLAIRSLFTGPKQRFWPVLEVKTFVWTDLSACVRYLLGLVENINNIWVGTIVNSVDRYEDWFSDYNVTVTGDVEFAEMADSLDEALLNNEPVIWIVAQVFLANFQFRHLFG